MSATNIDTKDLLKIYPVEDLGRSKANEIIGSNMVLTIINPNGEKFHVHPDFALSVTGFVGNIFD